MKIGKHILFVLLICLFANQLIQAQENDNSTAVDSTDIDNRTLDEIVETSELYEMMVIDGDTLPLMILPTVYFKERKFENNQDKKRFQRMNRLVKKVYPYAEKASDILMEIERETELIDKRRKEKKYLRKLEKELKVQFEDKLKDLTVSQGKVLVKIVERNTGKNMNELIKQYKSGFSAFVFGQLGKRYGYNLKSGYDPNEPEFKYLEDIVTDIESMGWETYQALY